ncbi:unnamed protein product, partial [marine sediment metagenome]
EYNKIHHPLQILNHEIIFKNGKFTIQKPDIPVGHINEKSEVIGNIYENPELLK